MANIKVNLENSKISMENILDYKEEVEQIDKIMRKDPNSMNNFLGWIELPTNYDKVEFERIKEAAKRIRKNSEVFVCIGIGGSYLGARAVIEALTKISQLMLFLNLEQQQNQLLLLEYLEKF